MRREPAVRIDLVRGQRQRDGSRFAVRDAFERGKKKSHVRGELLDVGTPNGWLATNLRLAKQYPEFSTAVAQSQGMAGA